MDKILTLTLGEKKIRELVALSDEVIELFGGRPTPEEMSLEVREPGGLHERITLTITRVYLSEKE